MVIVSRLVLSTVQLFEINLVNQQKYMRLLCLLRIGFSMFDLDFCSIDEIRNSLRIRRL